MSNHVAHIDALIKQHEAIKAHMLQISSLAEDIKAMGLKDPSNLAPDVSKALNSLWLHITHTFSYLEEGLRIHWDLEDQVFPELIGQYLTKSLDDEHVAIRNKLNELNSCFLKNNPRDCVILQDYLYRVISELSQLIREHEEKENVIFQLAKKVS